MSVMLHLRRIINVNYNLKKFVRGLSSKNDLIDTDLWTRIKRKVGILEISKSKLQYATYKIYSSCTDSIDHLYFFQKFAMADTFFSWFLVTELHVWMTLVRAMEEGEEGRQARNFIVGHLWKDTEMRCKALGPIKPSIKRDTIQLLNSQFQAAIVAYDEGLLSNDRVLACALWRRFFLMKCDDPEKYEVLISYIRRSVKNLDSLNKETFLLRGEISWPPVDEIQDSIQ